jgi:hypothetical protein
MTMELLYQLSYNGKDVGREASLPAGRDSSSLRLGALGATHRKLALARFLLTPFESTIFSQKSS